ncbi:MAG: ZIP family metal transporter [Bacteroidetes bacterium]|nr:ZIP family metal transporter [Bacteroidota bacterium]
MTVFQYLILFGFAFIGGAVAFLIKKADKNIINIVLSFSGAYLFGITVLHLVPEIYSNGDNSVGVYVLLGFFIQIFLEQFSKGIEHGHMHPVEKKSQAFVFSIMFGLGVHAFLEGIPLGANILDEPSRNATLYGIAFHKAPAAFALTSILIYSGFNKPFSFTMLVIFCAISPISALLAENVGQPSNTELYNIVTGIVVGSFLHISTTILFESSTKIHKLSIIRILAILAGAAISLLTIH